MGKIQTRALSVADFLSHTRSNFFLSVVSLQALFCQSVTGARAGYATTQ